MDIAATFHRKCREIRMRRRPQGAHLAMIRDDEVATAWSGNGLTIVIQPDCIAVIIQANGDHERVATLPLSAARFGRSGRKALRAAIRSLPGMNPSGAAARFALRRIAIS